MAAPVLKQGNNQTNITQHTIYFPKNALFYNFYNYKVQTPGNQALNVPFDDFIPLFIKGGKIVHLQEQKQLTRSNQLSSGFTLMIAFDEKLESSGQMLSINDYNSDDNIIENCLNQSCLVNISAKATTKKTNLETQYNVLVKFQGDQDFQIITVKKVTLMGLQKQDGSYVSKSIQLSNEFQIINGSTLQVSFTENEKLHFSS